MEKRLLHVVDCAVQGQLLRRRRACRQAAGPTVNRAAARNIGCTSSPFLCLSYISRGQAPAPPASSDGESSGCCV